MQTLPVSISLNNIGIMSNYDGNGLKFTIVCGECLVAFKVNAQMVDDKNIVEIKQERQTHICPECGAVNTFSLRVV